jgi:anti-sigma factor RsiW
MTQEQQLKLQALLDGELPESEAREILSWVQRDSAAAALLAELKNTRTAMAKAEPHLSVPETREFYWSKIEHEILRREPRAKTASEISFFTTLRRFLLPAGALAALVIAGLVFHFHGTTSAPDSVADTDTTTVETTLASTDATTYRDASEGTTLVWFSPEANDSPAPDKKPAAIN